MAEIKFASLQTMQSTCLDLAINITSKNILQYIYIFLNPAIAKFASFCKYNQSFYKDEILQGIHVVKVKNL